MTTGVACPNPILQFFNNLGQPNVGGSILTQVGGVNTATYQDSGLTTPLPNPIPLNSRGEVSNSSGISCQLFLTPNTVYIFTMYDANGNQLNQAQYVDGVQVIITQSSIGTVLYPQTAAESAAGIMPTNYYVPSHLATGEVCPYRYGAAFNGVANDTVPINDAFSVATQAKCGVVLPGGTALVGNLLFGTNSTTGQSSTPAGCRGQGGGINGTVLKAIAGTSGTLFNAQGASGIYLRDFLVDCNLLASVGINTSWGTGATNNYNQYEGIIVQGYNISAATTNNGWLALNDNQSKFKDIVCRQEGGTDYYNLSGMRIEGSGGSIFLDNVTCSSDFLSLTCQNAEIHGGYSFGVRINESQSGVNYLSFSGGTQIYANPTQLSHLYDANPTTHFATNIIFTGTYFLASSGTAQTATINCGCGGKFIFEGCAFEFGSSTGNWNLYGAGAYNALVGSPSVVELNGCTMGSVIIDTPTGFITERKDVTVASGVLSDYPSRVVYRSTYTFGGGLAINTYTNVVPAANMTEGGGYLLVVNINNYGSDSLSATALVNQVGKNGSEAASAAIASGSTANATNSLAGGVISFRYSATANVSGTYYAGIDVAINEALANGSTINVTLIRIANPSVTY